MNDYSAMIRKVFGEILSGVAKLPDSPCSAQAHFDSAIHELAMVTSWRPDSPELLEIIASATEHIRHYKQA
jgi:hypothetical protein